MGVVEIIILKPPVHEFVRLAGIVPANLIFIISVFFKMLCDHSRPAAVKKERLVFLGDKGIRGKPADRRMRKNGIRLSQLLMILGQKPAAQVQKEDRTRSRWNRRWMRAVKRRATAPLLPRRSFPRPKSCLTTASGMPNCCSSPPVPIRQGPSVCAKKAHSGFCGSSSCSPISAGRRRKTPGHSAGCFDRAAKHGRRPLT